MPQLRQGETYCLWQRETNTQSPADPPHVQVSGDWQTIGQKLHEARIRHEYLDGAVHTGAFEGSASSSNARDVDHVNAE